MDQKRKDREVIATETLGERLRRLRGRESREKLAVRAGISLNTIQKIESAQVENPTIYTMRRLAHALGVNIAYLIEGE